MVYAFHLGLVRLGVVYLGWIVVRWIFLWFWYSLLGLFLFWLSLSPLSCPLGVWDWVGVVYASAIVERGSILILG